MPARRGWGAEPHRPSLVDAWLFGYAAVILAAPLPVNELQQLVNSYEPITRFANRVLREQFGGTGAAAPTAGAGRA